MKYEIELSEDNQKLLLHMGDYSVHLQNNLNSMRSIFVILAAKEKLKEKSPHEIPSIGSIARPNQELIDEWLENNEVIRRILSPKDQKILDTMSDRQKELFAAIKL